MFGLAGNPLSDDYYSRLSAHYPSTSTTAIILPAFPTPPPELMIPAGNEHDSMLLALKSELGYASSGCSSYGGSPSSMASHNGTPSVESYSSTPITYSSDPGFMFELEPSPVTNVVRTAHLQGVHLAMRSQQYSSRNESSIMESIRRANPYSREEKKERIERYKSKKNLRNFNKKIKYECRKNLADSRTRIRGRFASNGHEIDGKGGSVVVVDDDQEEEDYDNYWINFLDTFSVNLP